MASTCLTPYQVSFVYHVNEQTCLCRATDTTLSKNTQNPIGKWAWLTFDSLLCDTMALCIIYILMILDAIATLVIEHYYTYDNFFVTKIL